ncbi:MAG TPA: ABC transporter permease [Anaerolineales bacterium]|nr:ABC transporter permease [Anaerolineales bacterium]
MLRSQLRALRAAAVQAFLSNAFDGFILFTLLIQPLVIALMALWILRGTAQDYGIYVVVGSGLTGLWSGLLFISGNSMTSERWTGTLEMIASVPTPLPVIALGKILANVSQSLISMIGAYLVASVALGYALHVNQPVLFGVSVILMVFAFVSLGMVLAPLFITNPDVQRFQNAIEFPVYILAGFLFPIALLPTWTTPLSYLLSPYWAAVALHETSSGGGDPLTIAEAWVAMILLSVLYLFLSGLLFRTLLRRARRDGTLSLE